MQANICTPQRTSFSLMTKATILMSVVCNSPLAGRKYLALVELARLSIVALDGKVRSALCGRSRWLLTVLFRMMISAPNSRALVQFKQTDTRDTMRRRRCGLASETIRQVSEWKLVV